MEGRKNRVPSQIARGLRNAAPLCTIGEEGEDSRGYKSVCIYVANGLAGELDLFKEIARTVFGVQRGGGRKWPLLVFGFGHADTLQHEGKFFDFGYLNDSFNVNKVAETVARVSGSDIASPAIIPELFPRVGIRSLYVGKTRVERDDLLIVIGMKGALFFDPGLADQIGSSIRKRILLIEVEADSPNFTFKPGQLPVRERATAEEGKRGPQQMGQVYGKGKKTMGFKRQFSDSLIQAIKGEALWEYLYHDAIGQLSAKREAKEGEFTAKTADIFPAIRDGRIDFYHRGGKLFSFGPATDFTTHHKYASVIKHVVTDGYVTESNLQAIASFVDGYGRIKENCSNYSGLEAQGVASICERYSCAGSTRSPVVALDTEVSLAHATVSEGGKRRGTDRIDLLLFDIMSGQLRFFEAKHYSNPELRAKSGRPKVVTQIERYRGQLNDSGLRGQLVTEYTAHIEAFNKLFRSGRKPLPVPVDIDPEPRLLIFGFDRDQQKGRLRKDLVILKENGLKVYKVGDVSKVDAGNLFGP